MIASDPYLVEHRGAGLKGLLRAVRSRKWIIVLSVAIATLLTLGVLARKPDRYTAEAVVALDVRKIDILPTGAVVSPLPQESPVLRTELDLIGSRWMAEKVIDKLGIAIDGVPGDVPEERRQRLVDELLSRLSVSNDGRSFTIFIAFTADSPTTAARVANAFAETYLDQQMAEEIAAIRRASAWLGSKLEDLQDKLEASELAVQSFERSAGTAVDESVSTARARRLNALNAELAVARSSLAQAQTARNGVAELASGERGGNVRLAEARVRELEGALAAINSELAEANAAAVKLKQLQREASANRAIYESFLNRYKQTLEQESLAAPEARLISEAQPPDRPANSWLPILILGVLGGAAAGTILAILLDRLDDRVRSVESLEEATGATVVGVLPRWKRRIGDWWRKDVVPESDKNYAEAVRRLCVAVRLSPSLCDPRVITVTSVAPACGKSAVCTSLARTIALSGRKVLLINADHSAWRGAKTARWMNDGPLGEVITGRRSFDQIVQTEPASAVDMITAATTPDAAHRLFGSEAFKTFLTTVRKKYDAIVVDAPPAASAGTALVGELSDAVLVVVRWRAISYGGVVTGLRQLDLCGIRVAGLVLTEIGDTHKSWEPAPRSQPRALSHADLTRDGPSQHAVGPGAVIRSIPGGSEVPSGRLAEAHRTGTDRP